MAILEGVAEDIAAFEDRVGSMPNPVNGGEEGIGARPASRAYHFTDPFLP